MVFIQVEQLGGLFNTLQEENNRLKEDSNKNKDEIIQLREENNKLI